MGQNKVTKKILNSIEKFKQRFGVRKRQTGNKIFIFKVGKKEFFLFCGKLRMMSVFVWQSGM